MRKPIRPIIKTIIHAIIFCIAMTFSVHIAIAEMSATADTISAASGVNASVKQGTTASDINSKDLLQNTDASTIAIPATSKKLTAEVFTGNDPGSIKRPGTTESGDKIKGQKDTGQDTDKSIEIRPKVVAPAAIALPAAAKILDDAKDNNEEAKKETEDLEKEKKELKNQAVTPEPIFTITSKADVSSVDAPGTIHYTIVVKNTGNVPLTRIRLSDPLLDSLTGPKEDTDNSWVLDVDGTWTYSGRYLVTQEVIDRNGVGSNNVIDGNGHINSTVTVDFAETDPPQTADTSVKIKQNPLFTITKKADVAKIKKPDTINYTIAVENTGNVSLTDINISDPMLDDLSAPDGDTENPGVLDVDEVWKYTGNYDVTQAVIDANGVDSNNVIDGDGDIDNTVMVDFVETDPPQTAYARVETQGSIDGDIFGKNKNYLHGFFSVAQTYTTNLYKTDRDPEGAWATLLTPGIWTSFSAPSTSKRSVEIITANASPGGLAINPFTPINYKPFQVYLLYSPQLELYHNQRTRAYQDPDIGEEIIDDEDINQLTGQDSLDRLTHRVDAYISYHSGNKLFLRAMDQYKISYDAFSERAYITDDKYSSNLFNISASLDATNKLRLRLDYSNFNLDYKDKINSDADRKDNSIAAYLFFRMTAKTSAFVNYEFADIGYNISDKDSHEHHYFAGMRWQMTGKSSGQIKGGFGEKKFRSASSILPDTEVRQSDSDSSNWMAEIQIDHNFNARTNFTFNAYRRYDEVLEHRYDYGDLENFYADYTLAHFIGLKMSRALTSKIHFNLDTSFFYDEFKGSRANHKVREDSEFDILVDNQNYQKERRDTQFAVSPSINFIIFKWLTVNGAYIFTDHDSNYPTHDYIDHTFFLRASLTL